MSPLCVAFLDVGQGDTSVIYDPDSKEAVIVDCVNYVSTLRFLEAIGITRLRALILTHPHLDHYLGAVALLNECGSRNIIWDAWIFRWDKDFRKMPSMLRDNDGHSDMVADAKTRKRSYQVLLKWSRQPENKQKHIEDDQLSGDARIMRAIKFLHPLYRDVQELFETGNLNNLSYVIQVADGDCALLTGDIEPAGWNFGMCQ